MTNDAELGDVELEALLARDGGLLVLFTASWCGVDRAVRELVTNVPLPEGTDVLIVDVDRFPGPADRYGVEKLPEVLLLDGGEVVERLMGAFGRTELSAFVAVETR